MNCFSCEKTTDMCNMNKKLNIGINKIYNYLYRPIQLRFLGRNTIYDFPSMDENETRVHSRLVSWRWFKINNYQF